MLRARRAGKQIVSTPVLIVHRKKGLLVQLVERESLLSFLSKNQISSRLWFNSTPSPHFFAVLDKYFSYGSFVRNHLRILKRTMFFLAEISRGLSSNQKRVKLR